MGTPIRPHAIVCGAGLTGLTTAWQLRRQGLDVTVLEADDAVGGVVQSIRRDGYLVELGPNSCTLTTELAELVDAVGLTATLRVAAPQAQRRYIVRNGRPLAVPSSPGALLRSPLFSLAGKLRMLAEPLIGRRIDSSDESVADFIRRRLGSEPLAWAVDPFVSGVYAGDPARLSVRHAFPRLAAMEREHGSLLRGMIAGARRSRVARGQPGLVATRHTMVSFADGIHTLPRAIAESIGSANVQLSTRVIAIERHADGCHVTVEQNGARRTLVADVAIVTVPLHALPRIDLPAAPRGALQQLATLEYPPVVSLALGFRRADVAHALDGFGCLIPSAERRQTLGVLFSSTLFDGRAPDDHVLLTCFIGGVRHAELGAASTDSLLQIVRKDLADLLGVQGAPTFVQRTSWPTAIPQYALGHDAMAHAAEAIEASVPGLILDGQFRRGVSVGDCIAAGGTLAARAVALAARPLGGSGAAATAEPHTPVVVG